MRELTTEEMDQVFRGGIIGDFASDFGAVGTVVGYVADSTVAGATTGRLAGQWSARRLAQARQQVR